MPSRRTCILLIPSIFILITFLNISSIALTSLASLHQRVEEVHVRVAFFNQTASFGRYMDVRRQLGLTERLVFEAEPTLLTSLLAPRPTSISKSTSGTRPSHDLLKRSSHFHVPLLNRAVELTVLDIRRTMPKQDDALRQWPVLQLTPDSSWEYTNSKEEILGAFSVSAQRDFEEEAAADLARQQKTAARNRRKLRKKQKGSQSSAS